MNINEPPFDLIAETITDEIKYTTSLKEIEHLISHELKEMYDMGVAKGKANVLQILESEIRRNK